MKMIQSHIIRWMLRTGGRRVQSGSLSCRPLCDLGLQVPVGFMTLSDSCLLVELLYDFTPHVPVDFVYFYFVF